MDKADLFSNALGPENGVTYRLSRAVADAFPGKAIVEGLSSVFDVGEYARAGHCTLEPEAMPHIQSTTEWSRAHGLFTSLKTGIRRVGWQGQMLWVAKATWPEGYSGNKNRHWVIADDQATAERFANEVCAWCNDPRQSVLVYKGGCWSKDHDVWRDIQAASFDDLVLAGGMREEIRRDFDTFLGAREDYERYGVPWKRGVLFLGPPGNGKTHCLRAVIRHLGKPCLYVRSLVSKYETDDAHIARVFERAHELTPCCLVFEDLDAMITDQNRSMFLNELDGFANASGMLTLATTNHPERLDPSILERPSRFDRKYHFALPEPLERQTYCRGWNGKLDPKMRLDDAALAKVVEDTEGFSFAYLKELFLSAMIRWVGDDRERPPAAPLASIMTAQLTTLRDQMKSEMAAPAKPVAPKFDDFFP